MTQPSYVPIVEADQVRASYQLRTPTTWKADRVADLKTAEQPQGPELGVPGPDQGYALLLAHQLFAAVVQLSTGITAEDALVGATGVARARAAEFGRAPVGRDVELALVLFGFLGDAPGDLVEWRSLLFRGASHHYDVQRRIVEAVRRDTLKMTPEQVRSRLTDWRTLVAPATAPASSPITASRR